MPKSDALSTAAAVVEHLDHIERGDIAQAITEYAEDAVFEVGEVAEAGNINRGIFHGHEAIGPWLESRFSSFERGSYRLTVEESIENGDRVYDPRQHARGEASGVDVTLRTHHVFTVRDGLIVRHAIGERCDAPRGWRLTRRRSAPDSAHRARPITA